MYRWNRTPDFVALRRAAQANLAAIASGEVRRREESLAEHNRKTKEYDKLLRKERNKNLAKLRIRLKKVKDEIAAMKDYYDEQTEKYTRGTQDETEKLGYEELDHRYDELHMEASDIEDRIWAIEESL